MAKVTEKSLKARCTELNMGALKNTTFGIRTIRTGKGYKRYLQPKLLQLLKVLQLVPPPYRFTSVPDNAAIAKTVIAMAHSLHMKVIAEGVETEGQLNYLRSHGCDEMQGYYFSQPVPALEFEQLLRENRHLQLVPINGPSLEKTILVVDDEKEVATALQRMLVLEEYRVLIAGSAAEGFELLANNQVSVIISDQRMPVMTGTEFLSRVKELYPDTVRIILTAHADLNSVTDAINRGAVYKFLNKPWSDDDIRKTIDEAFKLRASLTLRRSNVPWS